MSSTPAPPESVQRRMVKCMVTLMVHLALLIMLISILVFTVPIHMAHFDEYGLLLPWIAELLDSVSRFVMHYWIAILLLGMLLDTAIVFMLHFLTVRQRWLQQAYGYLWFLGVIVLLGLIQTGLTVPLIKIGTVMTE